jgi:hypothetical protein
MALRETIRPGWAWPTGSRSWHYVNEYGVSLCLAHQLTREQCEVGTMESLSSSAMLTQPRVCKRCAARLEGE